MHGQNHIKFEKLC